MTQLQSRADFAAAVSQMDGTLNAPGLHAPAMIRRDEYGVAHIRAEDEHDAWFAQGYAAAQDRLWQMEYDRRRAVGRWAEAAGVSALPADRLARRLQLGRAAKADVEAMSEGTRAMFEAYAEGVNAYLSNWGTRAVSQSPPIGGAAPVTPSSGQPLPAEYALTDITPEPWEPWHSVAGFKVRHVLMGVWQQKLSQGRLLAMIGPEAYAKLDGRPPFGSVPILPPGGTVEQLYAQAADEIAAASEHLGFLAEVDAGSNSWAVHGSRTTTGMPVICNDSHRALDVPSVYWQVHVSCPAFDVIGATFPGVPGFPHFGHNGRVVWNITHTSADYQDLYVEQFDPADPTRYRTPEGWATAEHTREVIQVRGGEPVEIETWRTRHGAVVHGDPHTGAAITLRYTATDRPCQGFEVLRPMLDARTVAELHETQRRWVDPVNNLVSADVKGNIGYLTRGEIPVRSSQAHRQFPAPGWIGEHEWTGSVPFERLPQAINPPEGFIATANQKVTPHEEPYISHAFAVPSRAERLVELLSTPRRHSPAEIMAMQGDVQSVPARSWAGLFRRSGPFEGDAERARAMLAAWDGNLLSDSGAALLYAYARRAITRALFQPIVNERAWTWLMGGEPAALGRMVGQWLANVIATLDDGSPTTPDGRAWNDLLPDALASAWQATVAKAGADSAAWRWVEHHGTHAKHTLAAAFPDMAGSLNPPRAFAGGDSDTIQCAAYGWSGRADFDITSLSVYRQAVDLTDIAHGSYVIPGGVSGFPATPHYTDQLELWRTHQRIPMHYTEEDVAAHARHTLTLVPA